ncbi:MAG: UPF0175 family protein [Candidatus Poribacteria bacterium]|nr:UPF0175 family protein [Candidatus Poribacteria bacterium]
MSTLISDDLVRATQMTEQEIKLEIALLLFEKEKLTLGQAADYLEVTRIEFQRELAKRKIPIHYGVEELRRDIEALDKASIS